ncbi:MAG: hypothetical protein ACRDF7_01445 [Candidatus Limnocylindrales bacterium]
MSTQQAVAGSAEAGSPLTFTAQLPTGWEWFGFGANRGTDGPPSGIAFIVSLVDNTFQDPCAHVERNPKIGPTVADLATALAQIPHTTATAPTPATIAGYTATSIDVTLPASLPCAPDAFWMWQDSPGGDWWAQGPNEDFTFSILEVGVQRVVITAKSHPGTSAAAKAELAQILDSIVFTRGS